MRLCAKFQSPTLRGGADHRNQPFSPKEERRLLHYFRPSTLVSKSFSVILRTDVARDIARRLTVGACEKVSPGRG